MTEDPTQSVPPPSTSFLDDSFTRLRSSGYSRDTDGRWFGGVCTGLAQRFGVDPVLIRAAAVVLAFLGGIGLTAYVILWLLLPDRRGDILAERAVRQGDAGPIALLVLAAFLVLGGVFSIGNGNGWFAPLWLIPVAAIAWLVLARRNGRTPQAGYGSVAGPPPPYGTPLPPAPQGANPPPSGEAMSATPSYAAPPMASAPTQTPPPYAGSPASAYRAPQPGTYGGPPAGGPSGPYGGRPTPPAPPRPFGPVGPPPPPRPRRRRPSAFVGLVSLGIALVGIGLGAALDDPLGFPGSSATLGFLIALTGVSVVVLTLGLRGRASGFSGFLVACLALLLVTASAASRVDVTDGLGDRTWTPVTATGTSAFSLGAGDATLDLRRIDSAAPTTTPQRITVEMGAGSLLILVPPGLDTRVDASVGLGDITHRGGIDGGDTSGRNRSTSTIIGAEPVQVLVDAELGLGQITIQEQR
jgi:phage shock protein PspC (stress-responsive transcriptional regulator)